MADSDEGRIVIDERTRGLTLIRPWPYAFTHGPVQYQKRVENRSWTVPLILRAIPIALHAGKGWDEGDRDLIEEVMGCAIPGRDEHASGQIFAVCVVRMCLRRFDARIPEDQRRWAFGPVVWVCEEFVELAEPVACSGAQGLWTFDKRQAELAELKRVYAATIADQKAIARVY